MKVGPKLSLRPFLHRALQLLSLFLIELLLLFYQKVRCSRESNREKSYSLEMKHMTAQVDTVASCCSFKLWKCRETVFGVRQ